MRAVKLTGTITGDHKLMLDLPDDLPTGPAEVIVLVNEASAVSTDADESFEAFLDSLGKSPHRRRSKAEIDRYLEQERNSWGEP